MDRSPSYLGTNHRVPTILTFFSSPPQNDTLMRYLLDELHAYETDYSDALAPTSREATASFAGEAALLRPATTEALRMAHAALTTDVATLRKDVMTSQAAMAEDISQKLNVMTNLISSLAPGLGTLASPQDTNGECIPAHTALIHD